MAAIAGCDGAFGPSRAAMPDGERQTWERVYPYSWLGVLADVAPSTDELIYAWHPARFAMHSMRSATVSRLYLQVPNGTDIADWPKPSSVRDHSADIMHAAAHQARRIAELTGVPEPVWQGFEQAVAVQLAERYGRAGQKAAAETGLLIVAGYMARIIDQGYWLASADALAADG